MNNITNNSVELIKIVKEFNLEKIYAPSISSSCVDGA